jgi:hypothetical protein
MVPSKPVRALFPVRGIVQSSFLPFAELVFRLRHINLRIGTVLF